MQGLPPTLEDHFRSPRSGERLAVVSGRGRSENPACGDLLEIEVRVDGGRVEDAAFRAHGCSSVIAVASLVLEAIRGAAVDEVARFDTSAAVARAGGLPPTRAHAIAVVERALREALAGVRR